MLPDIAYSIALNEFNKFGPRAYARLFKYFKSSKDIFTANNESLRECKMREEIIEQFTLFRDHFDVEGFYSRVQDANLNVITATDTSYPPLLKTIYDPPFLLFTKGKIPDWENKKSLAIVGSRKATDYGAQIATTLTRDIVRAGIITVSGLAYGIDEIVHTETIRNKGTTVAVLGFGILHKSTNRQIELEQKIIENGGLVISEFSLDCPGHSYNFPIRNRLISGIANGTLIIEATQKSGSLITARSALEQNREVFAVPGNITSVNSFGTNELIKNGAHTVTQVQDITSALDMEYISSTTQKNETARKGDTQEENNILSILSRSPMHIDDITRNCKLPAHIVASTLSLLELKGLIQNAGGEKYVVI